MARPKFVLVKHIMFFVDQYATMTTNNGLGKVVDGKDEGPSSYPATSKSKEEEEEEKEKRRIGEG